LQFISATACLQATVFKIPIPSEKPRSDEFRIELGKMATAIQVGEFVPDEKAAKEIQASVDKAASKGKEGQSDEDKDAEEEEQIQQEDGAVDDPEKLKAEFLELYQTLEKPGEGKTFEDTLIKAEEFEKDEDSNFHIDFMAAMGNCRAVSYKLEVMDWIQVKLKAGRIVPAMATTTAAIAGLQALELVKVLAKARKEDHRNIFLNLAVPIMQASEPGDVEKIKLTETISATLWDRWEVEAHGLTL